MEKLLDLRGKLLKSMKDRLDSGEYTAADLKVIADYLKANNVDAFTLNADEKKTVAGLKLVLPPALDHAA